MKSKTFWAGCVILFEWLCIKNVLCLNLHLFEDWTNENPLLLFKSSLAGNWSYSLERGSTSWPQLTFNEVLSLDSSSGILYLYRHKIRKLAQNPSDPLEVRVISRTHVHNQLQISGANTTIIPLTLYFYNVTSSFPSHRKLRYTRNFKPILVTLYSNSISSSNDQICMEKNQVLLDATKYIPSSLIHSVCDITLGHKGFHVDKDFQILSSAASCVASSEHSFEIFGLLRKCYDLDKNIPFKVTVYAAERHLFQMVQSDDHRSNHRLKRATTSQPPVFSQAKYQRTVPENQPSEFSVIHVTATDPDDGEAGKITYTLVAIRNSLSNDMFTIDPISGLVKTAQEVVLDREQIPEHNFLVIATDSSPYRKSGTAELTIIVEDDNDNTPTFGETVYNVDKQENIPVMTPIITLRATDKDIGQNAAIRYTITEPASSSTFKINRTSGSITTLKVLDREETASYRLVIQAKDQAPIGKQRSSSATVNINVLDENDNFPQFLQDSYTVSVAENLDVSSKPVIVQVSATDSDEGRNKAITYSITGGNFGDTFYIDANTGDISVQKPLNYEQYQDFRLKIKASDNGEAKKTNSTTVWVRITDINDNHPYFENPVYQGTVLENEPADTSVLTVRALDADSGDNQVLVYSISNPPNLPFNINSDSGQISVKTPPDREKQPMYQFIVQVEDKGDPPLSATASVQIIVRDVNDNSPVFSQKTYFKILSEDTPLYKQVVEVVAHDKDTGINALLTYDIISGNNDGVFAISETGTISLVKKLNFKIQDRYILTIQATDQGQRYDKAEVYINVTDINKHVPTFDNAPYQFTVDENLDIGVYVGQLHANDDDVGENARITYELQAGVVDFAIDPNTGIVTTREKLDTENQAAYSFDVKASDHGEEVFSDIAGVTVFVRDVNDNPPQFEKASYDGSVSEAAFDGTSVLQVSAKDIDQGKNAQVNYRIADGSDGRRDFEVDAATGEIRVAQNAEIDREVQNNYTLSVIAYDGGLVPLTSTVEVRIKIADINDNPPAFASDEIIAMVSENKKIGSTVAVVEAVDPDEGANAVVEYSFEGGFDADKFLLQNRPGEPAIILNHIDLDYEADKKEYEILLRASSDHLFSLAVVKIQVQDVNDNWPILKDFTIIFNNFVDHFPTAPIGRIPAFDPDVSDQEKLRYSFILGNEAGFLHLNESTGEITLDPRLNSDIPRTGSLQVTVTDGLHEVTAKCTTYFRLVTLEMLQTSVTIRLNNMTSSAFLSPLFMFFVDALATIIHTNKDNIFVINVKNDTDVQAEILNVTVAVREKTVRVGRESVDVFYAAEYLQEQIYLQRTLLANLSMLQVLPFDDNLCVQELCPYFERCLSWLNFGMAAPFISSDTMLFRPIYPDNGYRCTCPKGFTGMGDYDYLCDVEVDYCYSNPCNNSGECERTEGGYNCKCHSGFAGKNCEINLSKKYQYDTCPTDLCRPPSVCQPLIDGGFRCESCPNQDHYNQFCQLTTRSFPKGSFLIFPSLKTRHRFTIQLKFATQQRDGLLFYNGRFNERHDFIALEIVDGQVQFSFSLGAEITKVSPFIPGGVNDGNWHQVTVAYLNRTATVSVGEDCDTEISVRFGDPINYTCAARVTHELDPICAKPGKTCFRLLDLTGPLQIGGLPTLPTDFQIQNKDFEGCMKDFYIDGELLDLNQSVANNGTQPGCPKKPVLCKSAPCRHGGTCIEGWGSYMCKCPSQWGGKDCSQEIDKPRKLSGDGYIYYSNQLIQNVHFTWYNGITFRTRQETGTLMYIVADRAETVHIELIDGYIVYTYTNSLTPQTFLFDDVAVNDGQWHDFEARWLDSGKLIMLLDFGQRQKIFPIQSSLAQKSIEHVYVGAQKFGSQLENNFIGCVQHIRVGNTQNSVLQRPQPFNAPEGCSTTNPCGSSPCPAQAACVDEWEGYSCQCPPGTLGPECLNICTNFNPCQNMANCHNPQGGSYRCECGSLQSGKYCENVAEQPCPAGWWGNPVCGPCHENCTRENGFNPNCDKLTGKCSCLANYYQPPGSYKCLPCDCYKHGSASLQCDRTTGQCPCIEGIVGKRCNQCGSKFAEIRMDEEDGIYACRADYTACPRIFSHNMWWDSIVFGVAVEQKCPNGAVGTALRNCSTQGQWEEPNMLNCTSQEFLDLEVQIEKIETRELLISTFVAKTLVAKLADTTSAVNQMFGNDLNITLRILNEVLDYENSQTDMRNLTSEQDSKYLTNLISALSDVFHEKYSSDWRRLNLEYGGTRELVGKLETYLYKLTSALELTSQGSPQPYNVVTDNIVLGVDTISKRNFSGKSIPKYDNIVKTSMFDEDTKIFLPQTAIQEAPFIDFMDFSIAPIPKAYVGYILYRSLGDLLPKAYLEDIRVVEGRPMSINSPVFTIVLHDNGTEVTGTQPEPVVLTLKQLLEENRTGPQCVFWNSETGGHWSTDGCTMTNRYTQNGDTFVECSCTHMTSFAVLMDASDQEYIAPSPVSVEIITFICIIICMSCLVVTFLVLFCFKHLQSNRTSIHTNLVFVFFMCSLAFIIGIDKTSSELFCRLVAIALHYFYMTGFSWLFVDILHIYRMLTEIRNIDVGSMKFYYLVAYVIPGIIVSLAVGLNTEGYGNDNFCWLEMSDKFIWSFAGPITFAGILNVFMFMMSVKAFCRDKITVSDIAAIRVGLFAHIIILMLWALIWVTGLLSVNYNIRALHYVFAILCLALGVFVILIYILASSKVRLELKKLWYKVQGRKLDLDENIGGTRSSVYSRSALAYRHDSPDGGHTNHISVGISTTSTTSKSTSKSSGGIYKGEDYLRSTNTSSSGGIPPYKHKPPPYGYDPEKSAQLDDPDSIQIRTKPSGNDSDSDSEMSEGHASLDLASSHSSDEDDDMDLNWEKQLPKNKKIEEAKEQARLKQQKEEEELLKQQQKFEQQRQHSPLQSQPFTQQYHSGTPPPAFPSQQLGHWPGDPLLTGYTGNDSEYCSMEQPTLSSVQPDVTLQTPEYKGRELIRTSPRPTDNLLNISNDSHKQGSYSSPYNSPQITNKHSPRGHVGSPAGSPVQSLNPFNSPTQTRIKYSPTEFVSSPVSSPSQVRVANKLSPRVHLGSPVHSPTQGHMTVKVLTHRGSVSSDSEYSHETNV